MPSDPTILLASDTASMRGLAESLPAELVPLPTLDQRDDFERWRDEAAKGPGASRVVVSVWTEQPDPAAITALDESTWERRLERPFLLWNLALGAAAGRCRDGGTIVALVQTPSALDSASLVPEASIGDGVIALVRSIAASEGPRGVRANTVTTPLRLVDRATIAPLPPLAGFPGRIDHEVAGAVRLLISDDAIGLTGRVLAADGGRTLT